MIHGSEQTTSSSQKAFKLGVLPAENTPLVLEANNVGNNRYGIFKGPSVPGYVKEMNGGRQCSCKRPIEDNKEGKPLKYCTQEVAHGPTINITSLLGHCSNISLNKNVIRGAEKGSWSVNLACRRLHLVQNCSNDSPLVDGLWSTFRAHLKYLWGD